MSGEPRAVTYLIRPVTAVDLPLIARWRAEPHVRRWWGEPEIEALSASDLADRAIAYSIVELAGRPFAFVQDYDVHAWPDHHFGGLLPGSRGLDLYIGAADLLHAGHGPRLLRQHVEALFAAGAPAAGIDPHPDNAAAIRAFEKAGFTVVSGPVETRWNRAILMERRRPR
jgi:aminoglycoside 6'-N-acetyltransferase